MEDAPDKKEDDFEEMEDLEDLDEEDLEDLDKMDEMEDLDPDETIEPEPLGEDGPNTREAFEDEKKTDDLFLEE